MQIASLVRYRECDWVAMLSKNMRIVCLRPIGGSARETCSVYLPLPSKSLLLGGRKRMQTLILKAPIIVCLSYFFSALLQPLHRARQIPLQWLRVARRRRQTAMP